MLSSLLLSFRESFEASLVIGIILSYLYQIKKNKLSKFVFAGAITGFMISLLGGYIGFIQAQELGVESESLFQGIMLLLASVLIAYFIVWMSTQNKNISSGIKTKVNSNVSSIGLFMLALISVFREGLELVVFTLTKISESATSIAIGSTLGIFIAIVLTYAIFKSSIKFNIKLIFKVLGFILIFIGSDMFSEGISKLIKLNDIIELILILLFMIPSLYIYFKNDLIYLLKRV